MGVETINNSLPPPRKPAENIKHIQALQEGKDDAIDTLNQINIADKLVGRFGPILIKYNNVTIIPSDSRIEEMADILEAEFDPSFPKEVSDKFSMGELAHKHTRYTVLIELGFKPTKDNSGDRFIMPWQRKTDKKGKFLYFFVGTNKPNVFLALTPTAYSQGETWLEESLVVAPNEDYFHNFCRRDISNNPPNGSRDMVPAPALK